MKSVGRSLVRAGTDLVKAAGRKFMSYISGGVLGGGGGAEKESLDKIAQALEKMVEGEGIGLMPTAATFGENQGVDTKPEHQNEDKPETEEHTKRKTAETRKG